MKPPKKRPRFLPEYVTAFKDRHGKTRLRFRRKGYETCYLKGELGSEAFREEYAACMKAAVNAAAPSRARAGTIDDLVTRYIAAPARLGPTPATQARVRAIVNRFRDGYGKAFVADVEFEHIDQIIAGRQVKIQVGKRVEGGVEAARKFRKELVRLFDYAEKIRMRPVGSNPVRLSERVRVAPGEASQGYHTWTEAEITQYRERHELGTRARLAMELMLWTGQRRIDAIHLGPSDVLNGRINPRQSKTGKDLQIAVAPQLLSAITAMPAPRTGQTTFLVTEFGRPFTNAGFGNWFRGKCDEADLPLCTAHGLRKAIMRRMAELGLGNQTLKSVSGHSRDEEVATYTRAVDQRRMADDAISILAKWEEGVSNLRV